MLQERKPFELLSDQETDEPYDQPAQLRDFVRRSLIKKYPSFREAEEAPPFYPCSGGIADAVAPIESGNYIIVFSIGTLLRKKNDIKSAVLPPRSLTKFLNHASRQPPIAQMDLLRDIQESLHASDRVFVFGTDHLMLLLSLGARDPIRLPLPAITAKRQRSAAIDILLVNHLYNRKAFNAVLASLDAKQSFTTGVIDCVPAKPGKTRASDAIPNAAIHVHIGSTPCDTAPFRIVDSYAQGKLVVHLDDPEAPRSEDETFNSQMQVEHNLSGIRIDHVRDLVPAIRSLLADEAMADLFRRNGNRIASMFNASVEQRLVGSMP